MTTPQQTIDRLGGLLSLVCALHCAVVPALVLLAALGLPVALELELVDDELFELGFSLAAVLFAGVSVGLGVRSKLERRPMLRGFALGLALLGGSHLVPGPEWLAHLVLVAGALTLAFTHRRSFEAARACCDHEAIATSTP